MQLFDDPEDFGAFDDAVAEMLRDNETFWSAIVLAVFGDVLGKKVMLAGAPS